MSFSSNVKSELCRVPVAARCCAVAESYGALLFANTFTPREIRIITGSADFAERLPKLFRRAFGTGFDAAPPARAGGKRSLVVSSPESIARVFAAFGLDPDSAVSHHINLAVLENECCRASFVRGAFLAGGSVTEPAKRYHLELVTDHLAVSRGAYSLLLEMGFSPRDTVRSGGSVIYFKQSEAIEDLLTTIGAPVSAMEIMAAKVEKDMNNIVNRRVNCDSANADKVVSAAQEQIAALKRLDKSVGLYELPDRLQETALLRLMNPEASLADLARLANPPVTKSCISHRLKKLMEIAAKNAGKEV